jgi:hypothetical protein
MIASRRIYYAVKPFIPWGLRITFRRMHAKRVRRRCKHIWPVLESAGLKPNKWPGWPDGKQFAVVLTHDVEGQKGWDAIEALAQLEMDIGFRSSFNLIPEGEYRVTEQKRNWLTERAFEVGIHDLYHDGKLYNSREAFIRHAQKINAYINEWNAVGFRSGFMLHNLDWISDLDVLYDASTFDTDPFEPQPEGAGTVFPFWVAGKRGRPGYVELPYTLAQDSTIFLLLRERTADVWKTKVDWIAQVGGVVLVNVHPDYVAFGNQRPTARQFPLARYHDLLTYLKNQHHGKFWSVLPRDLARWFKGFVPV